MTNKSKAAAMVTAAYAVYNAQVAAARAASDLAAATAAGMDAVWDAARLLAATPDEV